jgi:hypothetical protein
VKQVARVDPGPRHIATDRAEELLVPAPRDRAGRDGIDLGGRTARGRRRRRCGRGVARDRRHAAIEDRAVVEAGGHDVAADRPHAAVGIDPRRVQRLDVEAEVVGGRAPTVVAAAVHRAAGAAGPAVAIGGDPHALQEARAGRRAIDEGAIAGALDERAAGAAADRDHQLAGLMDREQGVVGRRRDRLQRGAVPAQRRAAAADHPRPTVGAAPDLEEPDGVAEVVDRRHRQRHRHVAPGHAVVAPHEAGAPGDAADRPDLVGRRRPQAVDRVGGQTRRGHPGEGRAVVAEDRGVLAGQVGRPAGHRRDPPQIAAGAGGEALPAVAVVVQDQRAAPAIGADRPHVIAGGAADGEERLVEVAGNGLEARRVVAGGGDGGDERGEEQGGGAHATMLARTRGRSAARGRGWRSHRGRDHAPWRRCRRDGASSYGASTSPSTPASIVPTASAHTTTLAL